MTETKFQCPHCSQHLEIPDELLGQTVECPTCKTQITLPKPAIPAEAPLAQSQSAPPPLPNPVTRDDNVPPKWHVLNGLLALKDAVFSFLGAFALLLLPTVLLGRTRAGAIYALVSTYLAVPMVTLCLAYMSVRAAKRTAAKYGTADQAMLPVRLSKGFHFVNVIIAFAFGMILPGALGLTIAVAVATIIPSLSKGGLGLYIILYLPLTLLSIVACGLVVSKRTQGYVLKKRKQ